MTSRAFLKLLRSELARNKRRLPRSLDPTLTPWQVLVYVLATGRLGQKFDKEAIAHMIHPDRTDIESARDRVDLALSKLRISVD